MTHAPSFNLPLTWSAIIMGSLAYLAAVLVALGPLAALLWWLG